jgi:glucosyl-3-phosphoglycerate synthase
MESLSIPVGYGVELATLMDTASQHGLNAIAQVDLGSRAHRHQANHDLALMAAELLMVAERRRPGQRQPGQGHPPAATLLRQFVRADGAARQVARPVPVHERPPAATVRDQDTSR